MMDGSLFPPAFSYFDPSPSRKQVWSSGGGTQSTAIAALIVLGKLPKPDFAVFVNTERENRHVMPYMHKWVIPALKGVGVDLVIVNKSQYATVDLTSRNGKYLLIPAYTTETGRVGKMPNYCSGEWKREVVNRWMRAMGVDECDCWIGFSIDEMRRIGTDRRKWRRNQYPLIHLRYNRQACVDLVKNEMGWPHPPQSSCWMCPNKNDREWLDMKLNRPDDFARAVAFQHEIRKDDDCLWLHPSGKLLEDIDFAANLKHEVFSHDNECPSGICMV